MYVVVGSSIIVALTWLQRRSGRSAALHPRPAFW